MNSKNIMLVGVIISGWTVPSKVLCTISAKRGEMTPPSEAAAFETFIFYNFVFESTWGDDLRF